MLVLIACTMAVAAPIMVVGGIIMALRQNVQLSALLLVVVPLLGAIVMSARLADGPAFRMMQERIDRVNRVLREQITGIRVVRAFVRDARGGRALRRGERRLTDVGARRRRLMASMFPTVNLVINVVERRRAVVRRPSHQPAQMQVGTLTAFLSYLVQILMSVMMATFMFVMSPAPRRAPSGSRRCSTPNRRSCRRRSPSRADGLEGRARAPKASGSTTRAPSSPCCGGISFVAAPGETTAIVGEHRRRQDDARQPHPASVRRTGGPCSSTASTCAMLDPDAAVEHDRPRAPAAVPVLGHGREQPAFGKPDATEEEMWRALEVAQAQRLRRGDAGGLDARIEQGGTNVSGGQRQRLAIARALVRRPDIYVFDDSFSALDLATDAGLRAALQADTGDAAVVIVAQRVSTIGSADQHPRPRSGGVVGVGTHDELMRDLPDVRRDRAVADRRERPHEHDAARRHRRASHARSRGAECGLARRGMTGGGAGRAVEGLPALRASPARPSSRPSASASSSSSCSRSRSVALLRARPAAPRPRHRHHLRRGDRPGGPGRGQRSPQAVAHARASRSGHARRPRAVDAHHAAASTSTPSARSCLRTPASTWPPPCQLHPGAAHGDGASARFRLTRKGQQATGCRSATSTGSRAATCSAGSRTTSTTSRRACSRR